MKRRDLPSTVLRASPAGTERHCLRCDRWLLWNPANFYRCRAAPSGLTASCQACIKTANALHKKAQRVGQPFHAHADDSRYWARYRRKNQRTTTKGAKP